MGGSHCSSRPKPLDLPEHLPRLLVHDLDAGEVPCQEILPISRVGRQDLVHFRRLQGDRLGEDPHLSDAGDLVVAAVGGVDARLLQLPKQFAYVLLGSPHLAFVGTTRLEHPDANDHVANDDRRNHQSLLEVRVHGNPSWDTSGLMALM